MVPVVNKRVKFIEAPDRARFPYAHSLFIDDQVRVLIDTACGRENIDYFMTHPIDIILNSHFHEDHIMNNHRFTEAEIWAHALDAPAIRSEEVFANFYGFHYFNEEELGQMFYNWSGARPSPVHRELKGGEVLDFGQTKVQVIHAPGHTPGHCCFLIDEQVLFSSDIDLSSFGPWYGHLCSDLDDYLASIKLCMEINPAVIITSHRGIIQDDIQKRLQNYLDIVYRKEERLLENLKNPLSLDQITDLLIFYGQIKEFTRLYKMFEKMAVFVHLQRLIEWSQVEEADGLYYLK
jgi:glyoxylase-like metal-dependent hydrolase (beta-lactamase superfamily II)